MNTSATCENRHICRVDIGTVFVPPGSVPVPESLLLSPPPLQQLEAVSTARLLATISPARLEGLRKDCGGCLQCVHDTVATGSTELGLQALEAKNHYHHHTQIFGEMVPQKSVFKLELHPNREYK